MSTFTTEQIRSLSPDAASFDAAKSNSSPAKWRDLGRSERALWGVCKGSADYTVAVSLGEGMDFRCNCPSRKRPCKHGLALLLIHSAAPLAEIAETAWIVEWFSKREETSKKRAEKVEKAVAKAQEAPTLDPAKVAEKLESRDELLSAAVDRLQAFLDDALRTGLATLPARGDSFATLAARLVDDKAPSLANRVRSLEEVLGRGEHWPAAFCDLAAATALLLQTWKERTALDAELVHEVRLQSGLSLKEEDALASGERLSDTFLVVGQRVEDLPRVRMMRSWIFGSRSGRLLTELKFSVNGQAFPGELLSPGQAFSADAVLSPGRRRERVFLPLRKAAMLSDIAQLGCTDLDAAQQQIAEVLAACPWTRQFPLLLSHVRLGFARQQACLIDRAGRSWPLAQQNPWDLFGRSAGRPCSLFGFWDGSAFEVLSLIQDSQVTPLPESPLRPPQFALDPSLIPVIQGLRSEDGLSVPHPELNDLLLRPGLSPAWKFLLARAASRALELAAAEFPALPAEAAADFAAAEQLLPPPMAEYLARLERDSALRLEAEAEITSRGWFLPIQLMPFEALESGRKLPAGWLAAYGPRGRWLLSLNLAWKERLKDLPPQATADELKTTWLEGTPEARLAALPGLAALGRQALLDCLRQTWKADKAELRQSALTQLLPLADKDDIPFLEECLRDRSDKVRQLALATLNTLPDSASAAAFAEHAKSLFRGDSIRPPDIIEAPWKDFTPSRKDHPAPSLATLENFASLFPLQAWESISGRPPKAMIAALSKDDSAPFLLAGLLAAAKLFPSRDDEILPLLHWYYHQAPRALLARQGSNVDDTVRSLLETAPDSLRSACLRLLPEHDLKQLAGRYLPRDPEPDLWQTLMTRIPCTYDTHDFYQRAITSAPIPLIRQLLDSQLTEQAEAAITQTWHIGHFRKLREIALARLDLHQRLDKLGRAP